MGGGELSDAMLLMLMVLNMMIKIVMEIVMETLPSKHTCEQESEDF